MEEKKNNTIKLLEESWKGLLEKKGNYYSEKDRQALKSKRDKNLELSYFYPTHVLPHPWWGNIHNPRVLVLALNPSYAPLRDEMDEYLPCVREEWENGIINVSDKTNMIKILDHQTYNQKWWDSETDDEQSKEITWAAKWWHKVFNGDENNKPLIELFDGKKADIFYQNIVAFNLLGYHSREYKDLPNNILRDRNDKIESELNGFINNFPEKYDYNYLPTQNAVKVNVQRLIDDPRVEHVIVLWGYKEWKKLGINFDYKKLIIVNKYNFRNNIIARSHEGKQHLKLEGNSDEKVKDFYETLGEYSKLSRKKAYAIKYQEIKKTLYKEKD